MCSAIIMWMVALFVFSACSPSHKSEVDELNSQSYALHYRNLDSAKVLAKKALLLSEDYPAGYAEACNNLAFVAMAKMNFKEAKRYLQQVYQQSDSQLELLIADIQNMRICQREAHNKDFYAFREKAMLRLRRLDEDAENLPQRARHRVLYAHSEFDIVAATYFYYVGLDKPMMEALNEINGDELQQDTAQYLNYLYNFGSGGAITQGTMEEINQKEFDFLIQCYMLASGSQAYPYWEANALQAISEHLQKKRVREFLIKNNLPAFQYLNVEHMPDSLLAGNFAQRALNLFSSYGDVYQTAGAYRTLAECYWAIGDYGSAADCLNHALFDNHAINAAPDLVASIREQLSLVYSAVDDKQRSDYNRNIYLDLQEGARQDRQLEARAALLDESSRQLNWMIGAVIMMILLVIFFLYMFDKMRRKNDQKNSISLLLAPLKEWKNLHEHRIDELNEKKEEVEEACQVMRLHVEENKRRNLEQRAKIALVNSITPFIDRMIHEVERLSEGNEREDVKKERYQYISELTDKINQYNDVLTQWIQMRQGELRLRIESFALQPLFDIVKKGKMGYQMKGIQLEVLPTDAVVKADRTLTLFMINTIADNARKFTAEGGFVRVSASVQRDMVEISIEDNGKGMDEEQLLHVFDRTYTGGHGFGLLNCKGIIDKYKKVSSIFANCSIGVESKVGKGSKFEFRLPCGVRRMLVFIGLIFLLFPSYANSSNPSFVHHQHTDAENLSSFNLEKADAYADSAYFSNINGRYERTLVFADSTIHYLNLHYLSIRPHGRILMVKYPTDIVPAEIQWFHDSLPTNYNVILDIRNESAVAALALHRWNLYRSNNKVYTQLFREQSADTSLPGYVRTMQVSENSKTVAVILLILLLLQLPVAYYLLYFRHVLSYRFAVEKINDINKVLLSEESDKAKLLKIQEQWDKHATLKNINVQLDEVVKQIEEALKYGIEQSKHERISIEMAEDELHKVEYENAKLHVSNSILDNCLSTLKHETMYYPSRIRQLIDNEPADVASLRELVDYYKSLYTMLSEQAMQQVEGNVKYDKSLYHYLFDLMKGNSRNVSRQVVVLPNASYGILSVEQLDVKYDDQKHNQLFTPLTSDLKYLLCRQIVREIGEVTNLRGCGILAKRSSVGNLLIEATLPSKICKLKI